MRRKRKCHKFCLREISCIITRNINTSYAEIKRATSISANVKNSRDKKMSQIVEKRQIHRKKEMVKYKGRRNGGVHRN